MARKYKLRCHLRHEIRIVVHILANGDFRRGSF